MTRFDDDLADVTMGPCWSCRQPVSPLALFCAHCGGVQPPAAIDPFARLGLHRHFAIDAVALERHYAGYRQRLSPERFAARPPKEQEMARRQVEAVDEAHAALADPLQRALCLLRLAGFHADPDAPERDDDPPLLTEVAGLRRELESAAGTEERARLGERIAAENDRSHQLLAEAFAAEELDLAATLVIRLARLARLREQGGGGKVGGGSGQRRRSR